MPFNYGTRNDFFNGLPRIQFFFWVATSPSAPRNDDEAHPVVAGRTCATWQSRHQEGEVKRRKYIIGMDPGLTRTGWAVIAISEENVQDTTVIPNSIWNPSETSPQKTLNQVQGDSTLIDYGVFSTQPNAQQEKRLLTQFNYIKDLYAKYNTSPLQIAIERPFLTPHNPDTAFGTAQVVGIIMLLAAQNDATATLYTPKQVKLALTGSGSADKAQMTKAVQRIFNLTEPPKPADTADAIAIAYAHQQNHIGQYISQTSSQSDSEKATEPTKAQQIWQEALGKTGSGRSQRKM